MLRRRVIACLDVRDGRVVKGTRFVDLRDVGDPAELASRYEQEGVDEIVFLDVAATPAGRAAMLDVLRRTAERIFVPLTMGGGVRSLEDMGAALRAGADKVSVNSAAVARPTLLSDAAAKYGSQCVVASIDAARIDASAPLGWKVVTHGGRTIAQLDAIEWAAECQRRGAGEILLTSIDRDGGRLGYDLDLLRAVRNAVSISVIASGGAGSPSHTVEACEAGADAVLVAGILHDGLVTVSELKAAMHSSGFPVRGFAHV
jgi:imidazole glycerol-phosphate synthase subunit HisF